MARYFKREFQLKDGRKIYLKNCAGSDAHLFIPFQQTIASESYGTNQRVGIHPTEEDIRKEWESKVFDSTILRLGAFDGKKMIGQCNISIYLSKHEWCKHIAQFGMMTIKDYWGSGLAQILMKEMESFARANDVKRIEAAVRVENPRGVNFYKRLGYDIEGKRRKAAFINNRFQDEYWIAKLI